MYHLLLVPVGTTKCLYNIKNDASTAVRLLVRSVDNCLSGVTFLVDNVSAFYIQHVINSSIFAPRPTCWLIIMR